MSSDLRNVADTGAMGEHIGHVAFDDLVTDVAVAGGVSFAAAEAAINSLISAGNREVRRKALADFEGSVSLPIERSAFDTKRDTRRKRMQDEFYKDDPDDWDEEKLKRFDQAIEDKMAGGKARSRKAAIKSILHYGATMKRTASMKVRRDK